MPELKLLFLQMAVILAAARVMAAAIRRIGQPEVIG
jgi:Kef-type K+ transport system membrane component KefB